MYALISRRQPVHQPSAQDQRARREGKQVGEHGRDLVGKRLWDVVRLTKIGKFSKTI